MKKQHRDLLSTSHDFLVNEVPIDETLEAIRTRGILSRHDFEQLRTLRHQGRKALTRYFLAVLPNRGPNAFEAFLQSLQDANAQHLVDLLLQQAGVQTVEDLLEVPEDEYPPHTPSDTPLPLGPDPHEYVVRLTRNNKLIRRFVNPAKISPMLAQNKVMTPREADMVLHLHGKNKKWDLILAVLLQRGERAYQAFMAALLKNDYSTVFHTINETSTGKSESDENYHSLSDNADEVSYDEGLNSDEDIKNEVTQLQQESAAREKMEDDIGNRADDTMLKMSNDLAEVSLEDDGNEGYDQETQNDNIGDKAIDGRREETGFSETIDDDPTTNSGLPKEHNYYGYN